MQEGNNNSTERERSLLLFSSTTEAVALLCKFAVVQPVLQQAPVSHGRQCVRTMRPPASEEVHERVCQDACARPPQRQLRDRQTSQPSTKKEEVEEKLTRHENGAEILGQRRDCNGNCRQLLATH